MCPLINMQMVSEHLASVFAAILGQDSPAIAVSLGSHGCSGGQYESRQKRARSFKRYSKR